MGINARLYTHDYFYSTPLKLPKTLYIRNKVPYTIYKIEENWKFQSYTEQLLLPHICCHQVRSLSLKQLPNVSSLAPILPWQPYMVIWFTCLVSLSVMYSPHTTQELSKNSNLTDYCSPEKPFSCSLLKDTNLASVSDTKGFIMTVSACIFSWNS